MISVYFKNDIVTDIVEKPDIVTYILSGIYVMKPDIFNYIPENCYYGMDTLIKDLLKRKITIAKYEIEELKFESVGPAIGNELKRKAINDYEKAQKDYKTHFK